MKKKINNNSKKDSGGDDGDVFFSFRTVRSDTVVKKERIDDTPINLYHKNMPKKLERGNRGGLRIFFVGIFILLVSSAVFYYFGKSFFDEDRFFSGEKINLDISAPVEVASGEEFRYLIKYKNSEKVDLSNAILTVNYPSGFIFKKSKPLPTSTESGWDLGYLRSGVDGEIEIYGNFVSEQDEIKKVSARLKYSLGGEKSIGFKNGDAETKITSTVLALDISGPEQLLGQDGNYVIKISNNSDTSIENVKLLLVYPENFIFKSSTLFDPQENSDNEVWLINNIDAGGSKEIEIGGNFEVPKDEDSASSEKKFTAQVGIMDKQDVFYLQQEMDFVTKLAQGDILLSLELNDSTEGSIVGLDSFLNYNIKYSNQTKSELIGVKIKLLINSNVLDWTTLEDSNDGVVTDDQIINGMLARSITWTQEKIEPKSEGIYSIRIKNKKYSQLDKTNSLDLKTQAQVGATIEQVDEDKVDNTIEGNSVVAQVNTDVELQTEAKSQNNNEYEIVWQLTNTIHEVENVRVEATLASKSDWQSESSVTAGDVYYDKELQKVSWQLNRIPVGVDIPLTAKFKLKTSDSGRPILLTDLKLTATDRVTGAVIKQSFSQMMGY